ncbi:MAG: GNAT family N-acetyltransferase [Chloroflexi bacterium]|nr:GNAT family N-acetyltransferase [Chloroflexota bacterium]
MTHQFVFHEVTPDRWGDLERLFEAPGGPKHCWCMVWRSMDRGASRTDSRAKKAALESRVREGIPVGILGYVDGEPVAWCSIAPRATYRDLGDKDDPADDSSNVWSLVCFFVSRKLRRQGVTRRLIAAAVERARAKGATVVEAYPVDPDSPSYRFMGFVSSFEAAGFREVGTAGTRRHVMRLTL